MMKRRMEPDDKKHPLPAFSPRQLTGVLVLAAVVGLTVAVRSCTGV